MFDVFHAPVCFALLGIACHASHAQEGGLNDAFSASGSLRTGAWSQSQELDKAGPLATGSAWLNAKLALPREGRLELDGWAQAARNVGHAGASTLKSDTSVYLREAYWRQSLGPVELTVGKQLIIWGRADGLNPTDNFSPRDYRVLAVDANEQRVGSTAISTRISLGDSRLQVVWAPSFQGDRISLPEIPNVSYARTGKQTNSQLGVRWDHTGGQVDWAVSYFEGNDRMPDFSFNGLGATSLSVRLANHRVKVWGFDAAGTMVGVNARTELAWRDAGTGPQEFFRKRAEFLWVVGGDKDVLPSLNLNLQLFVQKIQGFRDPNAHVSEPILRQIANFQATINSQQQSLQHGLTYRVAYDWGHGKWRADCNGVYSFTTHASLALAKLSYSFNDRLKGTIGASRYSGSPQTLFGQLRANSAIFAELKYDL